jgi:hypothetical protein
MLPPFRRVRSALAAALLFSAALPAFAATIISYDAGSGTSIPLPNTPGGGGWEVLNTPTALTTATETVGGESWDYITPASGGNLGAYRYFIPTEPSSPLADPSGWTATAVLRLVSAGASQDNLLASYVRIYTGSNLFEMSFMNNPTTGRSGVVFLKDGMTYNAIYANGAAIDNFFNLSLSTLGYVTFQIYYNPASGGSASLYANGILLTTLDAEDFYEDATAASISWGKSTSWGSNARWNEVTLETGNHVMPIPEPTVATLLLCGGLAGFLTSRKRR